MWFCLVFPQYADRKAKAISDIRARAARRKGEASASRVRKTIAVDIDEVLGLFVPALCDFHNEKYGTALSPADFRSYRFCDVWGGTDQEVEHSCRVMCCVLSCCVLPCRALSCLVWCSGCLVLSGARVVLFCLLLPCLVFCLVLSCLVTAYRCRHLDFSSFVNVPDHLFCAERFEGVRFLSN